VNPFPEIPQAPRLALSMREAARATGLSRSRLHIEVAQGRLKVRKAGRRTIVTVAELQRFLEALDHAA
jgi:hypothetical protein